MSNVIELFPKGSVADGLRVIANRIDDQEIEDDNCTLIIGSDVYHLGEYDDSRAAVDAVFNMTVGLHKIMQPVMDLE